MAPINDFHGLYVVRRQETQPPSKSAFTVEGGHLEAWAQGYNVGSLIILILIVACNYRSGIWLHKLILFELILALWHGTFIFIKDPTYGWYLSTTALLLFTSYQVHNVISWLKIRPFLPRWGSYFFIGSLIAVQPFWIAESWSNYEYFNNLGSTANLRMRPWEALVRDPWWIFTTWKLIDIISKSYLLKILDLVKINPRFGVMLACMFISIAFLLTDVVMTALRKSELAGINPYWRFALVFKCASDTIFLDDFKSVLDDIVAVKMASAGGNVHRGSQAGGRKRRHSSVLSALNSSERWETEGEHIECETINGPTTNISASSLALDQSVKRPKYMRVFSKKQHCIPVPKIHVQKEMTITSEVRKNRRSSYGSDEGILAKPAPVLHVANGREQSGERDSLSVPAVEIKHM
ncbi:hypothetical protein K504DRAFT_47949 [Pleomassaria siparia CBS 279.74]|uniref:Uncharacterized protein n=1 Tax=Pleomassaria siparia CBS 279.74 TaxID=1314801 RepID=A0A6G1K386_9PLEO|nr:hypothetical protein K504DRAFT_47949 [Pleomassaria siparia CBS 279.74]